MLKRCIVMPQQAEQQGSVVQSALRKDLVKLFENEGRILRFTAQLYKATAVCGFQLRRTYGGSHSIAM